MNDLNYAKVGGPGLQRSQDEDPERTDDCTHPPTGESIESTLCTTPTCRAALRSPGMEVRCRETQGSRHGCPRLYLEPRKDPERGRKTPVSPGQSSLELTAVGAPCQGHWAEVPLHFFRYHRKMRTRLWGISLEPHRGGGPVPAKSWCDCPEYELRGPPTFQNGGGCPEGLDWPLLLSLRRQQAGLAG